MLKITFIWCSIWDTCNLSLKHPKRHEPLTPNFHQIIVIYSSIFYCQDSPPLYNLEELSIPTYLFTGDKDYLADTKDVAHLCSVLQPVLGDKLQRLDIASFEHLDFIWGLDAHTKVYSVIVEDAKKQLTG